MERKRKSEDQNPKGKWCLICLTIHLLMCMEIYTDIYTQTLFSLTVW